MNSCIRKVKFKECIAGDTDSVPNFFIVFKETTQLIHHRLMIKKDITQNNQKAILFIQFELI